MSDEELAEKYLIKVAHAVGYSLNAEDDKTYIKSLIIASLNDMRLAGVSETTLASQPLVYVNLVIFVTDTLNSKSGEFKTSAMYIQNVNKLRWITNEE